MSADAPPAVDPRVTSRVLFFVFATVFLDLVGFGIVFPLMPFYVKSMGGSALTVGFLLSSFSLLQLLATPYLGYLSDRHGRRPVILLSLAGNTVAMVIFAAATRLQLLPLLFASRLLAGATSGNLSACQAAIADVTTGADRARGMGRLGAGIGLGLVLGPAIGGEISALGPWAPPLGAAAMAFADLVAAFALMPETRVKKKQPLPEASATAPAKLSLRQVLAQRSLLILLVLTFLSFLGLADLQTALALLVDERLGWHAKEVGRLFMLLGLISLVVQGFLIGRLARAFGQVQLIIAGSLAMTVGMVLEATAYKPAPLLIGMVLIGTGLGLVNPVLSSLASELAGEGHQGTVLGFAQSSGTLARTVGYSWAGLLSAAWGLGAPFYSGTLSALLAAGLGVALISAQKTKVRP